MKIGDGLLLGTPGAGAFGAVIAAYPDRVVCLFPDARQVPCVIAVLYPEYAAALKAPLAGLEVRT